MRGVRFIHEKEAAVKMRKRGLSIVEIEKKLGINRSTLSGWIKDVKLGKRQALRLSRHREKGLRIARAKALKWHNEGKKNRLILAEKEASVVVSRIDEHNTDTLELALAMLYWGEGFKKNSETSMGNSDPVMLKFFITLMRDVYHVPIRQMRCELFLRADQSPEAMKMYWSKALQLPLENFKHVSLDVRTKGSKTWPEYKGVCAVRCSNVAIQRKLGNISRLFVKQVLKRV